MPKAKPISLWPLSFDDALRKLVNTPPVEKPKPSKKRSRKRAKG